jgi:hypothetical protein
LIVLLSLVVIGIASIYIFIPSKLQIAETVSIHCVADAAVRTLANESNWPAWWPGSEKDKLTPMPASHVWNGTVVTPGRRMFNTLEWKIRHKEDTITSHVVIFTLPLDSCLIRWECSMEAGSNPLDRIRNYRKALDLKADMHAILTAAKDHLSKFENIYGFHFNEGSTKDTALMSTKAVFPNFPTIDNVYGLVNKLKAFCQTNNCVITGVPMLNVTPIDSNSYQAMVAVPVQRTVPAKGDIFAQKMVPGKFIITDIIGGPGILAQTYLQLQHYFEDYHRTRMAIPFEYMVTDRQREADTSKWHTLIYSPVY